MAEGPQVRLRAEWLHAGLAGEPIRAAESPRDELRELARAVAGRCVQSVVARGKNILFDLGGDRWLRNHLRMRGRWRRVDDPVAPLPPSAWLALRTDRATWLNLDGEVLELLDRAGLEELARGLGPDACEEPYPRGAVTAALAGARGSIAAALLDQSCIAGVGNTAKSEALFLARVDPRAPAAELEAEELDRVVEAVLSVTRESYAARGRWVCRVHQKAGRPCPRCGRTIERLRDPGSGRESFRCPGCQRTGAPPTRGAADGEPGSFHIGCAVWAYSGWVGPFYPEGSHAPDFLRLYAERLTAVEGNATFYAFPAAATFDRWALALPRHFRLCPKLPRAITHEEGLEPGIDAAQRFVALAVRLGERLGPIFAQLPATYGPERLEDLDQFLRAWPRAQAELVVELRHPGWFREPCETELNERLARAGAGRAILDARSVHGGRDDPQAGIARRKPLLPIPAEVPPGPVLVRFVGHPDPQRTDIWLPSWAERVDGWLRAGRDVYFFAHCPDERCSPAIARRFQARLERRGAPVPALPWNAVGDVPHQLELF